MRRLVWGLVALTGMLASAQSSSVKRIDPPMEGKSENISNILKQAKTVAVYCGHDVDDQMCKFFFNAFAAKLRPRAVSSVLYPLSASQLPSPSAKSFFVPPMTLPVIDGQMRRIDVTLRLLEVPDGPNDSLQLYVSGFAFDASSDSYPSVGLRLPEWMVNESGGDVGPTENDKIKAARNLSSAMFEYWQRAARNTTAR